MEKSSKIDGFRGLNRCTVSRRLSYQYLVKHEIPFDPRDIFADFGVPDRTGYRIIQEGASARRHLDNETLGRKRKVTEAQIDEADKILQDEDLQLEGKRYTWEQLAIEVGADVVGQTMRRIMQAALNYHKCLACVKNKRERKCLDNTNKR